MEAWLAQRVLAHVPTPQLHESINAVLQEEFASVNNAVNDVAAAFAKLEEVRDAVSKLERNPGGRSSSLMAATANAMLLQRDIGETIEQLATGMDVARLERKRKRGEEVDTQEAEVTSSKVRTDAVQTSGEQGGGAIYQVKDGNTGPRASDEKTLVVSDNLERSVVANRDRGTVGRERAGSPNAESSSGSHDESESDDNSDVAMASKDLGVKSRRSCEESTQDVQNDSSDFNAVMNGERGETRAATDQIPNESGDESESGDDDEDEVEGSEAAWKALMSGESSRSSKTSNKQSVQDFEQTKPANDSTGLALEKSATYLKAIAEDANRLSEQDRSFIIPDILIALKESVEDDEDATQGAEVASSLNIVIGWWGAESGEQIHHLKLYRAYAEAVKTYVQRLPKSAQKIELDRLVNSLSGVLKCFGKIAKGTGRVSAANRPAHQLNCFVGRVGDANKKSPPERKQRLLRIVAAFKKETFADLDDAHWRRILKALNRVAQWLCEDPRGMQELHIYRMLVRAAQQLSGRIRDPATWQYYVSLLQRMWETITDPCSLTSRKFLSEIEHRAAGFFEKVKVLNNKSVPGLKLHHLIDEVESLVNHTAYGWYPRRDMTIRKCVKELKSRLIRPRAPGDQKLRKACAERLARIAKWKVEPEPATVRRPTS